MWVRFDEFQKLRQLIRCRAACFSNSVYFLDLKTKTFEGLIRTLKLNCQNTFDLQCNCSQLQEQLFPTLFLDRQSRNSWTRSQCSTPNHPRSHECEPSRLMVRRSRTLFAPPLIPLHRYSLSPVIRFKFLESTTMTPLSVPELLY